MILGDTGTVTLDAVRWCAAVGITVVQVDRTGRPLLVASPPGRDDARLRRAQALAHGTTLGVAVTRYLLGVKLAGQADNARHDLLSDTAADRFGQHRDRIGEADVAGCAEIEAQAANLYFAAWAGAVAVRWASRDEQAVPDHCRIVTARRPPLLSGRTPRKAADPINALCNYGYTLAEVVARSACVVLGLDPGLGVSTATPTTATRSPSI